MTTHSHRHVTALAVTLALAMTTGAWASAPLLQQIQLTVGDGAAGDNFGVSVALDGDTALVGSYADDVGANRRDVGANADQGAAYVFSRPLLTSKDQCKSGGWKTFGAFKNQGDCVSFVSTKGKNPPSHLP